MNPIEWKGDSARVLDQRLLPHRMEWLTVRDAAEMASAIRGMALRGAPLIGIAAAYGLALEARGLSGAAPLDALEAAGSTLRSARPTAVNLAWAVDRVLREARRAAAENRPLADAVEAEAIKIHDEDRLVCDLIGKNGAAAMPRGAALTHCNTGALATGGAGTAYAALKEAFRAGKVGHVFACEARPFLQGARLTAFELQQDGIPFTLITDSMAGYFLRSGKISSVIVGADRIAANGDAANKIGTYGLAVIARENKIPFFVAAPTSTLDPALAEGSLIPVEERDPEEVTHIMGNRIAPQGAQAANPAFDITPASYISAIITELGIARPPFGETLIGWGRKERKIGAT